MGDQSEPISLTSTTAELHKVPIILPSTPWDPNYLKIPKNLKFQHALEIVVHGGPRPPLQISPNMKQTLVVLHHIWHMGPHIGKITYYTISINSYLESHVQRSGIFARGASPLCSRKEISLKLRGKGLRC